MMEEATDRMRAVGVHTLTSNDIVFLDHSVNDNVQMAMSGVVERSMEAFVRRLYFFSTPGKL